jgi:hypothetical protein
MGNLKTPLIFFIVSVIALYIFIYSHLQEVEPTSWTKTKASVDSVYTDYHDERQFALVEYTFEVDGQNYEGGGIALDEFGDVIYLSSTDSRIHEKVEYVRNQSSIEVYYNPGDPGESTPNLDINYGFLAGSVVAGLFTALGLLGVITALRGNKPTGSLSEDEARKVVQAVKDKYLK